MFRDLRQYLDLLQQRGELVRVTAQVNPELEITEITDRISKSNGGGKALLFENTGTKFPVAINILGADARMATALGAASLEELASRIEQLFERLKSPKKTMVSKLAMLPLLGSASGWFPRRKKGHGKCQDIVYTGIEADLTKLPILKCWPYDGGRFITLPLVHTIDPETGTENVGMYRMQLFSSQAAGLHWHSHKTGRRHYEAYRRLGRRMPVSVALGGDPVYTYSATAPLPEGIHEYLLAGFLRGRPVELVKSITNDLFIPSDCDFVIEGYVDPSEELAVEGPFGDHTGFYSLEDLFPRLRITAVSHRRDAVYPATIVGIPPQEDAYIAKATERIFLAPLRHAVLPEVEDIYLPREGVAHNLAIVGIRNCYPSQAFRVAQSLWGAGQMMFNKVILITDNETQIRDEASIMRLLRRCEPAEDVLISRGVLDILDHATATAGMGGKLALDLTVRREPRNISMPPELPDNWDTSFVESAGLLIVRADGEAGINSIEGVNFVILVDPETECLTLRELLWYALANFDPERDCRFEGRMLLFDARSNGKILPRYPNVITSDEKTVELVDRRWREYGIGEFIDSPSRRYAKLSCGKGAQR